MDKEQQKRSKNQSVTFPNVFTVKELNCLYPGTIEITLRYKITTAIDRGSIIQLGTINRPVGRPHVVYGKAPISKSVLQEAKDRGVKIYDDVEKKLKEYFDATDLVEKAVFSNSESKVTTN